MICKKYYLYLKKQSETNIRLYTQIGVDWRMFMAPIYKLVASVDQNYFKN